MGLIMDEEFKLLPPSVNTFTTVARGRKVLSARGRQFKRDFGILLYKLKVKKVEGKVKLKIHLSFKDRRKRDIDNYSKCILDVLSGKLYDDDSQIVELTITKEIGNNECHKFRVKAYG